MKDEEDYLGLNADQADLKMQADKLFLLAFLNPCHPRLSAANLSCLLHPSSFILYPFSE